MVQWLILCISTAGGSGWIPGWGIYDPACYAVRPKKLKKKKKKKYKSQGMKILNYIIKCPTQSCSTLCDPKDCSPPGTSAHGILQIRILEWVAILFSRESFQPGDWTHVSCTADRFSTVWATTEAQSTLQGCCNSHSVALIFIVHHVTHPCEDRDS